MGPGLTLALLLVLMNLTAARGAEAWRPVPLPDLRLGGELGRRVEITVTNNLLQIDVDRDFLRPFRERTARDGYVGLGKLLDATVRFAAYTRDARVLALKQRLVEEILRLQSPEGYVGMLAPEQRVRVLWDVHEIGYLGWGLLTDYTYFGDARSLAGARKAVDYVMAHWRELPADWGQSTDVAPHVAVTGLERTLLALHQHTGAAAYLEFCQRERGLGAWDLPIVIGRRPLIEGHIYAYLARTLAQLELNAIAPNPQLTRPATRALKFLLDDEGALITGAAGQCEIWTRDQDGRGDLGETCATAYQLRFYDRLLRTHGDPLLGDLMERTLFNALFAAQSPDGRRLRYFSPLEGPRVYFDGDTYCCPCNYRRIIAELPTFVYCQAEGGVNVNLYTTSEARVRLGADRVITLKQHTEYPSAGQIQLEVGLDGSARFPLRLRIPAWAAKATLAVNGQPTAEPPEPGTFHTLDREWRGGDRVTLDLPMEWRFVRGRARQAGRVALMRGPLVFCLDPSSQATLAAQDAADLGAYLLDPSSLGAPEVNSSVRPGGVAARIKAWRPGFSLARTTDVEFVLTEFPDPAGRVTFFRLRDDALAVADEVLGPDEDLADDFAGQLGTGWTWRREEPGAWRVTPHGLEIRLLPGNMWGPPNNARNVLVHPAPSPLSRSVETSVWIENQPTEQYEQVDLVWYYDDSHMVKIGQELVDGKLTVVMGREEGDRTRTIAIVPLEAFRVQVRFRAHGPRIWGEFRTAPEAPWRLAGTCDLPAKGPPHISLQGYQGPAQTERWARLSQFRLRTERGAATGLAPLTAFSKPSP